MDLNKLYYFIVTAEERSFTKAAKRLYISQQAISSHIKTVENEAGVQLIRRKPTFELTPAGASLYKMAVEIFLLQQKFFDDVKSVSSEERGSISLGASFSRSRFLLPRVIEQMRLRCPNVQLSVLESASSATLEQAVVQGDIDYYIGLTPHRSSVLQTVLLTNDPIYLVVPNAILQEILHANQISPTELKSRFSLDLFRDCNFLLPVRENNMRLAFDNYCQSIGFNPHIYLECQLSDTLFYMALDGLGLAIYPKMMLNHARHYLSRDVLKRVAAIPLTNLAESRIILGYNKHRELTKNDNIFIDICTHAVMN